MLKFLLNILLQCFVCDRFIPQKFRK